MKLAVKSISPHPPSRSHLDKLLEYCETGVKEGATLVYGGKRVPLKGK